MGRIRLYAFTVLAVAATGFPLSPVVAQGSTPCEAELHYAEQGSRTVTPRLRQYAWGNVRFGCAGQQTTMQSDSVAWYQDIGRFDMVGSVQFRDTTVTLDADSARYFLEDERLEAYGNVRLVNLSNVTVLTGPNLTYWRAVPALRDTTDGLELAPERIAKIRVGAPTIMVTQHMMRRPTSVMAAQYSLPFALATSLIAGPHAYESYAEDMLDNAGILALGDRIEAEFDAGMESAFPEHMDSPFSPPWSPSLSSNASCLQRYELANEWTHLGSHFAVYSDGWVHFTGSGS